MYQVLMRQGIPVSFGRFFLVKTRQIKKTLLTLVSCLIVFQIGSAQSNGFSSDVLIKDVDPGSVQYVNFTVFKAGGFTLRADGFNILGVGFNSDPEIYLFTKSVSLANLVDNNDDFNGLSSQLNVNLKPGQYIIAVSEFNLEDDEAVSGRNASSVDDPNTLIRVSVISANGVVAEGLISLEELGRSIFSAGSIINVGDFLSSLPMNGAHHRPLLTYHGLEKGKCVWVKGDLAKYSRSHDGNAQLAEVGGCYDFIPQQLRVGVGVGRSSVSQDLSFGGDSDLDGGYVIAELNYLIPGYSVIASLTGTYGDWDGDIDRAYPVGGGATSTSSGDADVNSYGIRGRLDWLNAFTYADINFSPRVAVTFNHTEIDSYSETGGTLPASFNSRDHTSKEVRFGIDGEKQIANATWVRGMIEGVHRFDGDDPNISGSFIGIPIAFNSPGEDNESLWGRIGMEIEHLFSEDFAVSASINGSTDGEDPVVSGGVMFNIIF